MIITAGYGGWMEGVNSLKLRESVRGKAGKSGTLPIYGITTDETFDKVGFRRYPCASYLSELPLPLFQPFAQRGL